MSRPAFVILLLAITVLAAFLRFHELEGPALWLDEILHLQVTQGLDWTRPWAFLVGFRETREYAENGALYYALQALGQRVAPGDLGVRLLPAAIGTATVPLFALVAGLFAPTSTRALTQLLCAFSLAVAPLHVYYSREGRPYYLLIALAVILIGVLARAAHREPISPRSLAAIAVVCLASPYIGLHALPVLASAAGLCALLLVVHWWRERRRAGPLLSGASRNLLAVLIALGTAMALCFALYLTRSQHNLPTLELSEEKQRIVEAPVFESQVSLATAQRFAASMTTAGKSSLHVGERAALLFTLAALGLAWLIAARNWGEAERSGQRLRALIVIGMFVLPAALSFLALLSTGRWYHVRYTATALPAFLLLASLGIVAAATIAYRLSQRFFPRLPEATRWAMAASALGVVVLPNVKPALADPYDKLNWRAVADFVEQMVLEDEPIVVANDWPRICLAHYLAQRGTQREFAKIWERSDLGVEFVAERPRGWLLSAGVRKSDEARNWMFNYLPIWRRTEEAFALFYFPNLTDFMATRPREALDEFLTQRFADRNLRLDFAGGELGFVGIGWSYPEILPEHHFQWAIGPESELALPIGEARDASIEIRASPFTHPEVPQQVLSVWLGDHFLESVGLQPDWNIFRIEVPAEVWASEPNVLRIFPSVTQRPADLVPGSTDQRELSVAYDWVRIVEE